MFISCSVRGIKVLVVGCTWSGEGIGGSMILDLWFGEKSLVMGPKSHHKRSGTFKGSCHKPCKCDLCLQYSQSPITIIIIKKIPTIICTDN